MKVYKIQPRGFASNTYAVTQDGKCAVLIDCAQRRVWDECEKLGLKPAAVLLTHGHFDHIGGCALFAEKGVPVYCSAEEGEHIFSREYLAICGNSIRPFPVNATLNDGDSVSFAGVTFKVIATPGHTSGGVCYLAGDSLFTGDTLFCRGVGRTDLPTGNFSLLAASVKKLYALEGDYTVYCGHEEDTTLSAERSSNPYIRQ